MTEITTIDTLPLLRVLAGTSQEMLSRGEIKRRGIDDATIAEAKQRGEIIVHSVDNTRDGEKSSLASILLTDVGGEALDADEAANE